MAHFVHSGWPKNDLTIIIISFLVFENICNIIFIRVLFQFYTFFIIL